MLLTLFQPSKAKPKFLLFTLLSLPLLLTITFKLRLIQAHHQHPTPQAILVLGGGKEREVYAAQLARCSPGLLIWVSSGTTYKQALARFQKAGISTTRLHLDYRATDTVTNFTTLLTDLQNHQIQHLYLVTSDFHMPRAKAIAFYSLGSRGIAYSPIEVPSDRPPETKLHILRDILRTWFWLITGRTGASLNPR